MNIHAQALDEIQSILRSWDGKRFYWIHLRSDPGAGASTLLRTIESHKKKFHFPLFRTSAVLVDAYPENFVRWMVLQIFQPNSRAIELMESLPGVYRQWLRGTLDSFKKKRKVFDLQLKDAFSAIQWGLSNVPIILIIDEFPGATNRTVQRGWEPWLEILTTAPVLFLTAGHQVPEIWNYRPDYVFALPGITMKGATLFLQEKYGIPELYARIIVNQLYLKSDGNLQKLHWLARTYFGDLLHSPQKQVKPQQFQRKIHSPASPQALFKAIVTQLSLPQQQILGFFSRLKIPISEHLTHRILSKSGFAEKDLHFLEKEHFLEQETLGRQNYVFMKESPFRDFIRHHVSGELLLPFQDSLRTLAKSKSLPKGACFFRVLVDSGVLHGAVEVAYLEAKALMEARDDERALECLHFLRRNLHNSVLQATQKLDVLHWLAKIYNAKGLTENYFEILREHRDLLSTRQTQRYLHISLDMAEALMKMDAFGEARYLIREAKATRSAEPLARFRSALLAGDLERYLGHPEYALFQYQEALQLLPKVSEPGEQVLDLFQRFKNLRGDDLPQFNWEKFIQDLLPLSQKNPRAYFVLQWEAVRLLMSRGQYLEALRRSLALYRAFRWQLPPEKLLAMDKMLSELSGAMGKWNLAKFYLHRALHALPFNYNPITEDGLLMGLGVVYKETGRYRQAIEVFQKVHHQAGLRNDLSQFVEAKLHLAHVQLLVHNYLKAYDYIRSSLRMEESLRDASLILTARLLALSLELQQRNWNKAENLLAEIQNFAWQAEQGLDRLNVLFYEIQFYLATENARKAKTALDAFAQQSQGVTKFMILSDWLQGKWQNQYGGNATGNQALEKAWQCAAKYGMWHLAFQIGLDYLETLQTHGASSKQLVQSIVAIEGICHNLQKAIDDEILQRQLEESLEGERWKNLKESITEKIKE